MRSSGLRNSFENIQKYWERGRKASENRQKGRRQYVNIISSILHANL